VGRGHPFYLDGIARALGEGHPDLALRRAGVFEISRGTSLLAWKAVLAAYRLAGRGGRLAGAYLRARSAMDYDRDSRLLRTLGRDARRWAGEEGILLADHPVLVGALRGRDRLWYQHGELSVPPETAVAAAERILVPTEEAADSFVELGISRERLIVTGLCVEAVLARDAGEQAAARRRRIAGDGPLTLAFFSSGAEPRDHVKALAAGAESLARSRHRALVFAAAAGALEHAVGGGATRIGAGVELFSFSGRDGLDRITEEHFSRFDALVSPAHERSNWAMGLGLPVFLVGPDVGSFPPLNRALLRAAGVAAELGSVTDAQRLSERLDGLRGSGELLRMSERGGGREIDGFRRAAERVAESAT
jgi:hypothetical protein